MKLYLITRNKCNRKQYYTGIRQEWSNNKNDAAMFQPKDAALAAMCDLEKDKTITICIK